MMSKKKEEEVKRDEETKRDEEASVTSESSVGETRTAEAVKNVQEDENKNKIGASGVIFFLLKSDFRFLFALGGKIRTIERK